MRWWKNPGLHVGFLLTAGLALLCACAVVETPPGGPADETPPYLVRSTPDSGAVEVEPSRELRFLFSEKMDRANAYSWLYFFPDQRVKKTQWKGATEAIVVLEEPLPADTLIVVEVAGSLRDAHKVKNQRSRRFPIATADSIPSGTIAGVLLFEEGPVKNGVVELYGLQPDTLEYFRRPMIRRTVTNETGAFVFQWLPVPSGPYLVRAFIDGDNNLRPGEGDPQRLLPDTLLVDAETGAASAGVTPLYAANTPGTLFAEPFLAPTWPGAVGAWAMALTDADTGYYPEPLGAGLGNLGWLTPAEGGRLVEVNPGLNRVIAFVDVDGDSAFGAVPDTLLPTSTWVEGDSLLWYLEPWIVVEGVDLEPGLSTRFALTAWGDSLTVWEAPPPPASVDSTRWAMMDSLRAALTDSMTGAPSDSLIEVVLDSLMGVRPDSLMRGPFEKPAGHPEGPPEGGRRTRRPGD